MAISVRDLEWLAGFLEGEGSFAFYAHSTIITAGQAQLWPLNKCQGLLGGSIRRVAPRPPGPHQPIARKPYSAWALSGIQSTGLMMTLFPLLSPGRQAQVLKALGRWRAAPVAPKYRTRCPQGHLYAHKTYIQKRNSYQSYCPICQVDRSRRWRENNRGKWREKNRIYMRNKRERLKERLAMEPINLGVIQR